MFNLVRKVVAGPKKTTTFEGSQLDLTYITERIIAMAFPASDLIQKTYRNRIEDVAAYFNERHPANYLIINVSSRFYDYSAFDGRVKDYQWPDHQAPPLTTLIQIGFQMFKYLRQSAERVVAVHCNHGKGRTGTAIISFMLLVGYFQSALECLKYYNSQRFNKDTYGVDQPCQLRYLHFVQNIIHRPQISPKLICYKLKCITQKGLTDDYFIKISQTRTQSIIFDKLDFGVKIADLQNNLLFSDIFIEIFNNTWKGSKKVARINFNLHFCDQSLKLVFKGKSIKISDHHDEFEVTLHLQYYCLCHLPIYEESVCSCLRVRIVEENYWSEMIRNVKECRKISSNEVFFIVQGMKYKNENKCKVRESKDKSKTNYPEKISFRSFSKKNFKSSHQEKLAQRVQQAIQKKMFSSEIEQNLKQYQLIGELGQQIQDCKNEKMHSWNEKMQNE